MRRYFGVTITIIVVISALIAMTAAGNIDFDKPFESEFAPNRSTYNSGPTGTRAFYQLLEESGMRVARWRSRYSRLNAEAKDAILIIIGPFMRGQKISDEESSDLRAWIASGGQALIISRSPLEQFSDPAIRLESSGKLPALNATPEEFIDVDSDELIIQPTELTRGLRGLALTQFASRMSFHFQEKARDGALNKTQDETGEADKEETKYDIEIPADPSAAKNEDN
ncbi:MAG TPA: DUF4350 domain-containing protein, partial [Blastocatellia bacterium]